MILERFYVNSEEINPLFFFLFFLLFFLFSFSGHFSAFLLTFFQKNRKFLLGVRPLDMAPVEQLGDESKWYVQLSAIWHWYLPLSIYMTFLILYYIHPFLFSFLFYILFFNLVLIN